MPTPIKAKVKLSSITSFAGDVFKLDFEVDKKYTRFRPGQFLHLTVDDFDPVQAYWPESRVFSICSPPRSSSLSVVYSVKGAYTKRMRDELKEGQEYWVKLPYGDFIIDQLVPHNESVVLICGGTGISPFVSYVDHCLREGGDSHIYLAYAVRSPDRLVFEEILRQASSSKNVTLRVWSEDTVSRHDLVTDYGILNLDSIIHDTKSFLSPHFLLSGPPKMLDTFSKSLKLNHGVDPGKIHIDEWE